MPTVFPLQERPIHSLADFGPEQVFASERTKQLLVDFLNTHPNSWEHYYEIKDVIETAWKRGVQQGIEQVRMDEKKAIARSLLSQMPVEKITHMTVLSIADIEQL